jgi:hypothetical protein
MMDKVKLEANFPANVMLIANDKNNWDAIITRRSNENVYPVTVLRNLTAAECYTRLGVQVPKEEVPELEGRAAARAHLKEAMSSIAGRQMITTSEMNDILLDAMLALGEDVQ